MERKPEFARMSSALDKAVSDAKATLENEKIMRKKKREFAMEDLALTLVLGLQFLHIIQKRFQATRAGKNVMPIASLSYLRPNCESTKIWGCTGCGRLCQTKPY